MGLSYSGQLAGALVQVDLGLLADDVRKAATDTLDRGQGEHHLDATVNVGVKHTENCSGRVSRFDRDGV